MRAVLALSSLLFAPSALAQTQPHSADASAEDAPIGISVRVIDQRRTGGSLEPLSPGSLTLTSAFAVTSAVGGLIAAHIDAKNLGGEGGKSVAIAPAFAPGPLRPPAVRPLLALHEWPIVSSSASISTRLRRNRP